MVYIIKFFILKIINNLKKKMGIGPNPINNLNLTNISKSKFTSI